MHAFSLNYSDKKRPPRRPFSMRIYRTYIFRSSIFSALMANTACVRFCTPSLRKIAVTCALWSLLTRPVHKQSAYSASLRPPSSILGTVVGSKTGSVPPKPFHRQHAGQSSCWLADLAVTRSHLPALRESLHQYGLDGQILEYSPWHHAQWHAG